MFFGIRYLPKNFFSYDCSNCMVFYSRIKRTCSNCMVFYSRIERATNTAPRNAQRASVAFCRPGRLPGELQRFRPPTSYLRCPTSHSLLPTSSFLLPSSDFLLPTSCFPLPASLLPTSCFPLPASPKGWPVFHWIRIGLALDSHWTHTGFTLDSHWIHV